MRVCRIIALFILNVTALQAINADNPAANIRLQLPGAEGRILKAYIYDDYLSKRKTLVDECLIDSLSKAELCVLSGSTEELILQVDYYESSFFVEPNKVYSIEFLPFDYNQNEKINALVNPFALSAWSYMILEVDSNELNTKIASFEKRYEQWMDLHFRNISIYGEKQEAKLFVKQEKQKLKQENNSFYIQYVEYYLADLEDFAKLSSKEKIFQDYVRNRSISYRHSIQMNYFKSIFSSYFAQHTKIPEIHFKNMIRQGISHTEILDTIGIDSNLQNEIIREWVLLYALSEVLYSEDYVATQLVRLIKEVAKTTKFKEHRRIAENILLQYKEKMERHYFSHIYLKDSEGNLVLCDSLLEEYMFHYVFFYSASPQSCPDCKLEINYLREIAAEFKKDLKIILFNTDYKEELYLKDVHKEKYPFVTVNFNHEIECLKTMGAIHLPYAILVDDKGRILQDKVTLPTKGALDLFKSIRKHRKAQF